MRQHGTNLRIRQVEFRPGLDKAERPCPEEFLNADWNATRLHALYVAPCIPHIREVTLSTTAAGLIVKKAVELLIEDLNKKLLETKSCKHRHATIYGPDGEVVSVVECDRKPDGHKLDGRDKN